MTRVLVFSLMMTWAAVAAAGEVVERGDVLLVSVAEDPKLGRDAAKVDADGQIQLPALGGIAAAGSDVNAIAARIGEALEQRGIIRTPTVLVEIAAYRPFYVGGAVAKPGAISFEPGLTVRHAILLAGGLGKETDRSMTLSDIVELRTRWRTTSLQILEVESRIARLEAELDRAPAPDFTGIDTRFAEPDDARAVMSLDADILTDRDQEWNADQAHLKDLMAMVDYELGVLERQASLQQQEIALQNDQVEKSRELRDKGLIPLPQLQELEREKSRLSRDQLDTQAFAARARQTKATKRYDLESAAAKWRIEVQSDLRDALMDRSRLNAEAEVLSASLATAGLSLTDSAAAHQVTIHRRQAGKDQALNATPDTEIQPGDLVEVSIVGATGG